MKGTRHNGRSGKDGVYNPLHNDRRFDPEHSEHIDNERVRQNIYWDCYQGYTTMADRGKEDNFSFNQIEMAYYVDHYSDYVINQNKRHEKARHPDRCKGVEDVLKNKKTCPEESIYQLGTIDEHASVETLVLVFDEFKKEFDERFGSNVHIIDWSLHMDEATPHIHRKCFKIWYVWCPKVGKCLCVLMEYGIAGYHLVIYSQFTLLINCRSKL